MFADKNNTYLYNTTTGEVYVKYSMGEENYKDVFVRMPHGIKDPQEINKKQNKKENNTTLEMKKPRSLKEDQKNSKAQVSQKVSEDMRMEGIKKAQEMMLKSFDTGDQ